jgi:hypothetical protein
MMKGEPNQNDFFQPSKPLRLLERNFGLRKLKCKYFPSLGSKDNEG